MWLFSYGSNDPTQLARRLGHSVATMPAFVRDHARCFVGWSDTWTGGVATLVPDVGAVTYGIGVIVTAEDLDRLDAYEGVPGCYRRAQLTMDLLHARAQATAYVAVSEEFARPTRAYLEAVARTVSTHWRGRSGGDVTAEEFPIR